MKIDLGHYMDEGTRGFVGRELGRKMRLLSSNKAKRKIKTRSQMRRQTLQ